MTIKLLKCKWYLILILTISAIVFNFSIWYAANSVAYHQRTMMSFNSKQSQDIYIILEYIDIPNGGKINEPPGADQIRYTLQKELVSKGKGYLGIDALKMDEELINIDMTYFSNMFELESYQALKSLVFKDLTKQEIVSFNQSSKQLGISQEIVSLSEYYNHSYLYPTLLFVAKVLLIMLGCLSIVMLMIHQLNNYISKQTNDHDCKRQLFSYLMVLIVLSMLFVLASTSFLHRTVFVVDALFLITPNLVVIGLISHYFNKKY